MNCAICLVPASYIALGDGLNDQRNLQYVKGKNVSSDIQNYQKSVVRTNCTDCLDRPTFVQRYNNPNPVDTESPDY